jgi:hypothetical protein
VDSENGLIGDGEKTDGLENDTAKKSSEDK